MSKHLAFSPETRHRWIVKRDASHDWLIPLNGSNPLDHVFLINDSLVGLWITSGRLRATIRRLTQRVSTLKVEQAGDFEAVLSAPVDSLEALCIAAKAKRRRQITEEQKQLRKDNLPLQRRT